MTIDDQSDDQRNADGGMPGGAASDDALLESAMGGDRAALLALLERMGPGIRIGIARRITGHLQSLLDEDDVMQVTYIEAVTRIDRFRGGGASGFRAWLARLAENNLVDAVRMLEAGKRPNPKKRVETAPGDSSHVALVELVGVTLTTPSQHAAKGEMHAALDRVLSMLPPDYEKVVRLYDLEQRPIESVAHDLGRSPGAVYMLRARAHERLRDLLPGESRFFSVT